MKCAHDKERLALLLMDSTSEQERMAIESHLAGCVDCQMELQAYKKVWNLMGEMPKPHVPDTLQPGFSNLLMNFTEETKADKSWLAVCMGAVQSLFSIRYLPRIAYGILLLAIGLGGGLLLQRPSHQSVVYNKQIDSLSSQVSDLKQLMMLSLLENPSASQRIQAVGYTEEIGTVNKKVIDALLTTLNEDPNVNVRLVTLEALARLADQPSVREGLVKSITLQDSPLLQSAIADTMVKLQEKKSIQLLRQLLNKKDLNEMVRLKIEQSIHKLI